MIQYYISWSEMGTKRKTDIRGKYLALENYTFVLLSEEKKIQFSTTIQSNGDTYRECM